MLNEKGRVSAIRRRGSQPRFFPRIGKPNLSIVSANRKTEICRNWQRGCCIYGAPKCAFAHGAHDLRHQSLDEMEISGRIPNATKFRCYPCLTWVATGACPYFSRCVFIHDPRIRGSKDAWLYSNSQHKGGKGGSVGSPFGRDTFYWPDMPRLITDDRMLPSTTTNYELDPILLTSEDPTDRAVYHLWYSLVGTLLEDNNTRTDRESLVAGAWPCSTMAPASTVGTTPINPKLKGGQQIASASTTDRPPSNRSWVSKNSEYRLPVFKRMSRGQSVAPDYVPVPGSLGPLFRCDECGLGSVLHHRGGPRSRPIRRAIGLRSHFPFSDISSGSVQAHTSFANKQIRKHKQSWRPETTGIENEQPHSEKLVVRSDLLSRRSTPLNMLGRVTGTTSFEIAWGLFGGEASNRANVNFVEDQVHDTGLGFQGASKPDDWTRSRSSQSAPPITSPTIPFPEVTDSSSRQHFPTPSAASPSTTPSPRAPFASLSQTLSSSPPVARRFDWSDGGSNGTPSGTVYPSGFSAGGV